jgi:hypothetical protein
MFPGMLLAALAQSPLTDTVDVLSRGGLQRIRHPDAVVMSMSAEPALVYVHKRLGYTIAMNGFRVRELAPLSRDWLSTQFEPVLRGPVDVLRDWRELLAAEQSQGIRFLVQNMMSHVSTDDIFDYSQFDGPLREIVVNVFRKEMNLMLHDLAAETGIDIIDIDAIAAEFGVAENVPDNFHWSGLLDREVRSEILRILSYRGVAGFTRTPKPPSTYV